MSVTAKRNRNELFRSVAMSLGLSSAITKDPKDFRATDASGEYLVKNGLYHATFGKVRYIIHVQQKDLSNASLLVVMRNADDCVSSASYEASSAISPRRQAATTQPIHEAMDKASSAQLSMFDDGLKSKFDALWKLDPTMSVMNGENPVKQDSTLVEILYKSEQTFIDFVPHKILVFNVKEGSRNDFYALAVDARYDRDFKKIMAMYRSGAHGTFVLTVMKHLGQKVLKRVDPLVAMNDFAVCLTRPKYESLDDITFRCLHAYPLIEKASTAMDGISYISVINDEGNEVTRRSCHFVQVLQKK